MKQGLVEKSAHLSASKVMLGYDEEPSVNIQRAVPIDNKNDSTLLAGVLSAEERISALEAQLAERSERVDELQMQLATLQISAEQDHLTLTELQADLVAVEAAAKQRGYDDGCVAAERAVATEWLVKVEAWEQGIVDFAIQHDKYQKLLEAALMDIALASITKVMGEQLIDVQQIGNAIQHIIYESGLGGAMKVFVAPAHYEELTRNGAGFLERLHARQLELLPDTRVSYGGCLLEAVGAVVDGRYEVQLKKLKAIVSEFPPALDAIP